MFAAEKHTLSAQKSSVNSTGNFSASSARPLAAVYIRVSTEEQAREGYSLAAQEETLKNYSSARGYDLYQVYRDEGKSAKDIKNRPAMKQLLQDAENGKFSAIFIYKLDRFSRSLKDLILTMDKLKGWNVDFVSVQERVETDSASGKLMFHIISAFAEFERNLIGERTTFGMERKALEGGAVSKPALGYKMVNKELIIDPLKTDAVRQIFSEFLHSDISLNRLAKTHNLTVNGLKKVLSNRTYLGEVKFAGKSNKGLHPAVIDLKLFEAVQEKLGNE